MSSKNSAQLISAGSVIVDLAGEAGGNCELTVPGQKFTSLNGVTILGYTVCINSITLTTGPPLASPHAEFDALLEQHHQGATNPLPI